LIFCKDYERIEKGEHRLPHLSEKSYLINEDERQMNSQNSPVYSLENELMAHLKEDLMRVEGM